MEIKKNIWRRKILILLRTRRRETEKEENIWSADKKWEKKNEEFFWKGKILGQQRKRKMEKEMEETNREGIYLVSINFH